jgi:hypothetical protein
MAAVEMDFLKPTMKIEKAISLMQDKSTSSMIQRHHNAINKLSLIYRDGYYLKDLSKLRELITLIIERIPGYPSYEPSLIKLLTIFSEPFIMERSSDENTYTTSVIDILLLLGKVSIKSSDDVVFVIAQALSQFCKGRTKDYCKEYQGTSQSYNSSLVERSTVASYLTMSLQVKRNIKTQIAVMETLLYLSHSDVNCNHILAVKGASLICENHLSLCVAANTDDSQLLHLAIEVTWNLLEYGSQLQISEQLSSYECIQILQSMFRHFMLTSTSQQEKQLRNDVAVIVTLVASRCNDAPFVVSII